MGLVDGFIAAIRAAVGLPPKGDPPEIIFLGLYEATVQTCAADGLTCDVESNTPGVPSANHVEVRSGIPGVSAVVEPGALVLLGWKGGDRSKPYCVAAWGKATVDKLVVQATEVFIGDATLTALINGIVLAKGVDPFTGATYGALGNASTTVMAKP